MGNFQYSRHATCVHSFFSGNYFYIAKPEPRVVISMMAASNLAAKGPAQVTKFMKNEVEQQDFSCSP
jgi:hypothetical protein